MSCECLHEEYSERLDLKFMNRVWFVLQFCKHQKQNTLKDLFKQDDDHQELGNFYVKASYKEKVCGCACACTCESYTAFLHLSIRHPESHLILWIVIMCWEL